MTLQAACACGQVLRVALDSMGKDVRCPVCNRTIRVGASVAPPPQDEMQLLENELRSQQPAGPGMLHTEHGAWGDRRYWQFDLKAKLAALAAGLLLFLLLAWVVGSYLWRRISPALAEAMAVPEAVSDLQAEVALGKTGYAISPPGGFAHFEMRPQQRQGRDEGWLWQRQDGAELLVLIHRRPGLGELRQAHVMTKAGRLPPRLASELVYVLPDAKVTTMKLSGLTFTRAAYHLETGGPPLAPVGRGKNQLLFVAASHGRSIEIVCSSDEPLDSKTFQIMDRAAKTFRETNLLGY